MIEIIDGPDETNPPLTFAEQVARDSLPTVAQNAIRHQLAGHTTHVCEALGELDSKQLRLLIQASYALASNAAQMMSAAIVKERP